MRHSPLSIEPALSFMPKFEEALTMAETELSDFHAHFGSQVSGVLKILSRHAPHRSHLVFLPDARLYQYLLREISGEGGEGTVELEREIERIKHVEKIVAQKDENGRPSHLRYRDKILLLKDSSGAIYDARLAYVPRSESSLDLDLYLVSVAPGERSHAIFEASDVIDEIGLTGKELDIIRFLSTGKDVQIIARELSVTPHTIRQHLKSIFRKTNTCRQLEIVLNFSTFIC